MLSQPGALLGCNELAPVWTATQQLMCELEFKRGYGRSVEEIRQRKERENRVYQMQTVKLVGYDERLYAELVRFGANNGHVSTDVNELGRL